MATWFAQNSSVNIDSVNQWNSAANGSGSWLTWASLGASDILVANGKTSITINVSFTCATITTAATGGTAGGGFLLAAGVTVTANVVASTTVCINRTVSGAESFIVGNVTAGASGSAHGVHNNSTSTISITGNVLGDASGFGVRNENAGTINVTGNVTAGGFYGIANISTGAVNITGNVAGGTGVSGAGSGVYNVTTAVVTITGNVTGGTADSAYGVRNDSTGTISVSGSITAGTGARAHGIYSPASAYLYLLGTSLTANPDGYAAIVSSRPLIHASVTVQHTYRVNNAGVAGVARSLYTGGTNLNQPAIADVRSGTVFGASSEYTGTLAVPSPTLVAIGVATDNTVGSYAPTGGLDAAGVRSAIGLASANLDTQLSVIQSGTNDIQTRIPAALYGGRISAVLDSVVQAQIDNIEDDTTSALSSLSSLSSAIAAVAAIFTGMTSLPNWLRRAWRKDSGTAGMSTAQTEINTGGTATFSGTTDSQEAIKDAIGSSGGGPAYSAAVVAARLPVGSAAGWPQEIVCGSAYLTALGTHVPLYVKDVDENILAAMGDKTFVDVDFKAILRLSPLTDANKLLAQPAATIEVDSDDTPGIVFNDDTAGEEYFELQIPKAKTAVGEIRTRYLCQVILRWGDGSEYEWIVNLGESKFIRGVSAAA